MAARSTIAVGGIPLVLNLTKGTKEDIAMVNGDPTTFMFYVPLRVTDPKTGYSYKKMSAIGGSDYAEAVQNAINCWQSWLPGKEVTEWKD